MKKQIFTALFLGLGMLLPAMALSAEQLVLELKSGKVTIEFVKDTDGTLVAPKHTERIKALAQSGAYDGIAFHRVIAGFMAQTGDVEFGQVLGDGTVSRSAGRGGSKLPDLQAEFSGVPFERGRVGMARSQSPNSGNSQFFIMLEPAPHLNGQYTVWGEVISGMEHVDNIKLGSRSNGSVTEPDQIIRATIVDNSSD